MYVIYTQIAQCAASAFNAVYMHSHTQSCCKIGSNWGHSAQYTVVLVSVCNGIVYR